MRCEERVQRATTWEPVLKVLALPGACRHPPFFPHRLAEFLPCLNKHGTIVPKINAFDLRFLYFAGLLFSYRDWGDWGRRRD